MKAAATRPFALGNFDCGIWLADWCMALRGIDPAQNMRGRYQTVEEALALTGTRSLPALLMVLFRAHGFRRTRTPVYGDVAAIRLSDGLVRGAIVTTGYVVIAEGGGVSRVRKEAAGRFMAWGIVDRNA